MELNYDVEFIPALCGGLEKHHTSKNRVLSHHNLWKNKFSCDFWTDTALFKHPYVLTSAFYAKSNKNWRNYNKIGNDSLLMADSGGFSVATKGAKLDALEILKWQELNSDIAFTLDMPPVKTEVSEGAVRVVKISDMNEEEYDGALEYTVRNNEIFEKNRTRKEGFYIFNCTHGNTEDRFRKWFDAISKFNFDGWAGGLKPVGEPLVQALALARFYREGIRSRVHLLGVGGKDVIPLLVYCRKYFSCLSFDSTSYCQGYMTKMYWMPDDIKKTISFGTGKEEDQNHELEEESTNTIKYNGIDKLPCDCVVCREIDHPSILVQKGSLGGCLIALHNLAVYLKWINDLKNMSDENLIKYIKTNCRKKTLEACNFIDIAVSDYWKAFAKYENKLPKEFRITKQLELF